MSMKRHLLASVVSFATVASLAGCSIIAPQPTTWVETDTTDSVYISWTDSNGTINGTLYDSTLGTTGVTSNQGPVTGTEGNGQITLRVGGEILGTSMSGTIDNQHLTLDSTVGPITFHPRSYSDYQAWVKKLQNSN